MKIIIFFLFLLAVIIFYSFFYKAPKQKSILWGVNFSQMQAENLKLDWKETYLALLDDLRIKNVKLLTNWDFVEDTKDNYYFDDVDWQVEEAQVRGANLIYVVGMKTGRWPECHLPKWAMGFTKPELQKKILQYIEQVILRYKDSKAIVAWQVENEPFFNFGECPWYDSNFLKKEVELVKSLDPSRKIIITDSGEQSLWLGAARVGDIVGATMYRRVWFSITDGLGFYFDFPIPPIYYWHKAQIIKYFFGKNVISTELQAEPWSQKLFYDVPLAEQEKSMNIKRFKKIIDYAKATGLKEFYFWGSEWWYWMKEVQNRPQFWEEARIYF
ncbi:MAG: hypothetical protein HYT35_00860 [Candidatus Staskawiczbacteria bacterium]|nr:hypothetical protein [Candidatus Staskawiczbacteria bacterium]